MNQLAAKKAYEISYALFRVSGVTKSAELALSFERMGTTLLCAVLDEAWDEALSAVDKSVYFLRLGRDVGVIGHANVSVLEHELERFKASVKEFRTSSDDLPDLNLGSYFSPSASGISIATKRSDSGNAGKSTRQETRPVADSQNIPANQNDRQDLILKTIKNSGNCRAKDLQDSLPNVSERTLRYDLQKLLERRVIERVGGGGPATFYRMRLEGETAPQDRSFSSAEDAPIARNVL